MSCNKRVDSIACKTSSDNTKLYFHILVMQSKAIKRWTFRCSWANNCYSVPCLRPEFMKPRRKCVRTDRIQSATTQLLHGHKLYIRVYVAQQEESRLPSISVSKQQFALTKSQRASGPYAFMVLYTCFLSMLQLELCHNISMT